ncbi:MAG: GyrI-like domain-containing protein [Alphaproteobacteria bacterium]|nr:GyrI-like domain-containing protein [Alphaproteobacteria bacterium]
MLGVLSLTRRVLPLFLIGLMLALPACNRGATPTGGGGGAGGAGLFGRGGANIAVKITPEQKLAYITYEVQDPADPVEEYIAQGRLTDYYNTTAEVSPDVLLVFPVVKLLSLNEFVRRMSRARSAPSNRAQEIAIAYEGVLPEDPYIRTKVLPEQRVAYFVHAGGPTSLTGAFLQFVVDIRRAGYEILDDAQIRMLIIQDPILAGPDDVVTEIQVPLR